MRHAERADRSGWALAGALALHLLAFVGVRHLASDAPLPPAPRVTAHREFSVDVEIPIADAQRSREPARDPVSEPAPIAPQVTAARTREPPAELGSESVLPDSTAASPVEAPEAANEAAESTATSRQPVVDLGIGPDGWQRWAAPGQQRELAPPTSKSGRYELPRLPPMSRTGGLQEGLEQRTRELGLSPSGRVISAFHNAAHASVAPEVGNASFNVTVLRSGAVEISVGAASGEVDKWRAVAARATEELKRKPPRIPDSRAGLRVVIDITAEEVYPSGLRPRDLHGPRLETALPRLTTPDAAKKALAEQNPTAGKDGQPVPEITVNLELPGVYVTQKGKVCGYRAGLTPMGPIFQGGCDLSNVGAKPQRIVRAKTRDEAMF